MLIKIQVNGRRAHLLEAPVLVCGNSTDQVEFEFDAEWSAYTGKTARFVYVRDGAVAFQDVPFSGKVANIPPLANITEVRVGVFAEDIITTTPAVVPCEKSIKCGTGEPEAPTADVYAEIMKLFNTTYVDPSLTPVELEFNPESENPQGGTAVAEAVADFAKAASLQNYRSEKAPLIVETGSHFWMRGQSSSLRTTQYYTEGGVTKYNDNPDQFTVTAASGSGVLSVTGGTGLERLNSADTFWGAVLEYDDGTCEPCIVTAVDPATPSITIYPPVLADITSGKLAPLYSDAQHLTDMGYKALAQFVYSQNPKHCDKVEALERYAPTTKKETAFSPLPGTRVLDIDGNSRGNPTNWQALKNEKSSFFRPLVDYATEGQYGMYKEFELDGRAGFLETFIGTLYLSGTTDVTKFAKDAGYSMFIRFEVDGEIVQEIEKTTNMVERFCFDIPAGSRKCSLKVFYKFVRLNIDTISIGDTTIWINTRNWNATDRVLPEVAQVVQMFDSWGAFWSNGDEVQENEQTYPQGASGRHFKALMEKDSGVTAVYWNRSIGGMTSRYGKQWFSKTVLEKHPSHVLLDYNINDENSATGSDLDGNYGLLKHPYDDTKQISQNGLTLDEFVLNMVSIFKQATVNGVTPIYVEGFIATPQTWFTTLLTAYEKYWNGKA